VLYKIGLVLLLLLLSLPAYAYHTETQTPYDSSISINSNDGSITVSWQESDGYEDNPPEYYIVYIGLTESADDVSIQTTFGFTEALTWRSHTFTAEYLYTNLSVDNQNIYSKVKAFHDTNGTTSDFTPVKSVLYDYDYVPTSTTSSSTTSSTTTSTTTTSTTTTTTLPKAKDVVEDNITTYLAWDEYGCPHPNNPLSYKQYLEAIESGKWFGYIPDDCNNKPIVVEVPEEVVDELDEEIPGDDTLTEEDILIEEEVPKLTEEEIAAIEAEIKAEEERLLQEQLDAEKKEEILLELEDTPIVENLSEEEVIELVEVIKEIEETIEVIEIEEEVIELDISDDIILVVEEEVEEEINIVETEVLPETNEEILVEPVQEIIEEKPVEEFTEEDIEIVQEVVNDAISNVEELTEEQVEVVADVLQVETEDVAIIAEAVKSDTVVAEAVEEYVERAVENADVEDYTLADVVTEIQFENFLENPIEVLVDFDTIDITTIGDDMTQDQREKAQEVVVPVILTRIATMAAFVFRKTL